MLRRTALCAATLVAVAGSAAPSYADPIDDVRRAAERVVGEGDPVDDVRRAGERAVGGDVIGGPGGGVPRGARSAVVGYIAIQHLTSAGQTRPTFTVMGELAVPTLWQCADNFPAVPYAVTCTPQTGVPLDWKCDVLHADVEVYTAGSRAGTSLDCDGGATPPEAETAVLGRPGVDSTWSTSDVVVSEFTCTIDGGSLTAVPDYSGGCGDPGAVEPR